MSKLIMIESIINSKSADDAAKGDKVFYKTRDVCKEVEEEIILDFDKIELVNTAFLNNAIGKLFDRNEFDLSKNIVKVANMQPTMIDLLKESISLAKQKYQN